MSKKSVGPIFVIEGVPAVGKSTLLDHVSELAPEESLDCDCDFCAAGVVFTSKEKMNYRFLQDTLAPWRDKNGKLNGSRYNFELGTLTSTTNRMETLTEAMKTACRTMASRASERNTEFKAVAVMERGPRENCIFALNSVTRVGSSKAIMERKEFAAYSREYENFSKPVEERCDMHRIRLYAPYSKILERMSSRGEKVETENYNFTYMKKLYEIYALDIIFTVAYRKQKMTLANWSEFGTPREALCLQSQRTKIVSGRILETSELTDQAQDCPQFSLRNYIALNHSERIEYLEKFFSDIFEQEPKTVELVVVDEKFEHDVTLTSLYDSETPSILDCIYH